ncbi:MAG: hypothetical protein QNK68_06315 [Flavobacteriales bacterium]
MEELEKLYKVLSENEYYTKSYDEFISQYNDPEYRRKVYDLASSEGLYSSDFNSFESKYANKLKKKEDSQPTSQVESMDSRLETTSLESQKPVDLGETVEFDWKSNLNKNKTFFQDQVDPLMSAAIEDFGKMTIYPASEAFMSESESTELIFPKIKSDKEYTDEEVSQVTNLLQEAESKPPSEYMSGFINTLQESQENGDSTFFSWIKGLALNPNAIPEIASTMVGGMSGASFGSEEGAGAVVTGAAVGAGIGATMGAASAGPLGAVAGAISQGVRGAMSAVGGTMFAVSTYKDLLIDELGDKPLTEENIKLILGDEEKRNELRNKALTKGASMGAFDYLTFGLMGRVSKLTAALGKTKSAIATTVVGATAGGLSSAQSSIEAGIEVDPSEVAGRVIVQGMFGAGSALARRVTPQGKYDAASGKFSKTYKDFEYNVNNSKATKKDVSTILRTATDEQIKDIDIKIVGDEALMAEVKARKAKAKLQDDIDPKITDAKDREAVIDMELEIQDLSSKNSVSANQRVSTLKKEISNIQEKYNKTTEDVSAVEPKSFETKPSIEEPFMARTEKGKQSSLKVNFDSEGKIESVVNVKTGKQASAGSVRDVEKQFLKNVFDVNQGKKAPEPQGLSERDIPRYIARESENVKEIVDAIAFEKSEIASNKSMTQSMFDENGLANLKGFKFTSESWERMTGKTPKESKIDKLWIDDSRDKNTGKYNAGSVEDGWTSLLAREGELPNDVGSRVDAQDVIEFIQNNNTESKLNKFIGLSSQIQKTPELIELESKFTDLTGLQATPSNIEAVLSVDPERPPLEILKQADKERLLSLKDAALEDQPGTFGKKRGPSVDKILGKEKTIIEVDEAKALTDQIKLEARAARESKADQTRLRKDISDKAKELVSKGKISTAQSAAIVSKVSKVNLNNNLQVEKAIDFIDKVYRNAEYAVDLGIAKKANKSVSSNLGRGDLGINNTLGSALKTILNIPLESISPKDLKTYNDFLSKFKERSRVIKLDELNNLTEEANSLYDKIYVETKQEPLEVKEAKSKRISRLKNDINSKEIDGDYIVNEYGSEVIKDLDDIDSVTLYNLVDKINTTNNKTNADLIKSVNDYAEARNSLINDVSSTKANVQRIQNELRDFASIYNKVGKEDLIVLTGKQLQQAQIHIDNINNGFYTYAANDLARTIKSGKASRKITPVLNKFKKWTPGTFAGRVYGEVKSGTPFIGTKRGGIVETVRSNPLNVIDDAMGNYKGKEISEGIFSGPTTSMAGYEGDMMKITSITDAVDNLLGSSALELSNKSVERRYAATYYLLQAEFEGSGNKKGTASGSDFVEKTIEDYNDDPTKSIYNEKDIDILTSIGAKYKGKSSSDILNSLSKKEKKAISLIQKAYASLEDKALIASTIVRGEPIDIGTNYVHHKVSVNKNTGNVDLKQQTESIMNPSTRSKAAISRTSGAKAIDFDPISTLMRSARYTLLDYHLTNEVKVSNKTIKDIKSAISLNKNSTKDQKEAANAISSAYNEVMENILLNNFSSYDPIVYYLDKARTIGYQAMLASLPRAAAELASNANFAILYAGGDLYAGVKDFSVASLGQNGLDFVRNVKSKTITKLYGKEQLSSSKAETTGIISKNKTTRASGKVSEVFSLAFRPIKFVGKASLELNDALISSPDKAISRPLFFGAFSNEFTKLTGEKINFDKVSKGDVEYMSKFKDQIEKSRAKADELVQMAATTNSRFDVILKNQINADDGAARQTYKAVNGLMSRFSINEYAGARQAVASMIGSGRLSKAEGAKLLIAINTRMATYLALVTTFTSASLSLLGAGEEQEDIREKAVSAMVGSAISLATRRTLGNVPSIPINILIEKYNEEYGQNLRGGKEYDKYKHSLVYNTFDLDDFYNDPLERVAITATGPYQSQFKSLIRVSELVKQAKKAKTIKGKDDQYKKLYSKRSIVDALGFLGLMPIYRDVKRYITTKEYSDKPKVKK